MTELTQDQLDEVCGGLSPGAAVAVGFAAGGLFGAAVAAAALYGAYMLLK